MVKARGPRSSPTELAGRLHSAALHLVRRLAQEDRALGVSAPRLSALSVLVFGGPRTIGGLAVSEGVTPPTMTRLVAAMEADGLVRREPQPGDRRAVRIAATDRGRSILLEGRARRIEALDGLLGSTTASERAALATASAVIEERLLGRP